MFDRRVPSLIILFAAALICSLLISSPLVAQQSQDSSAQYSDNAVRTGTDEIAQPSIEEKETKKAAKDDTGLDQKKLMALIENSGLIGILTLIVLAVGLMIILMSRFKIGEDINNSQYVLDELQELQIDKKTGLSPLRQYVSKLKGKYAIYLQSLQNAGFIYIIKENFNSFKRMFVNLGRKITGNKASSGDQEDIAVRTTLFELLFKLYQVFDLTRDTESFNTELANFIQTQKDKFNPFQTVMAYLSDTAGALGLLGTVWGMFLTFHKGTMDQQEIISGMGIALATTIIGLVVSLILNTFTTNVSNKFDSQLAGITKMANDLQLRLMKLGLKKRVEFQATSGAALPVQKEKIPVEEMQAEESEEIEEKPIVKLDKFYPAVIEVLEGAEQVKTVKSELNNLRVMVKDKDNIAVPGVKVYFSLNDSAGYLNGGRIKDDVETNDAGIANVRWTLGEQSGEKYLNVTAEKYTGKDLRIKAVATPDKAEKLSLVSGNFQYGPPNEECEKPFAVRVVDKYKNPIDSVSVIFKKVEGEGSFVKNSGGTIDTRNGTCTVTTNEAGVAETAFLPGKEQGVYKVTAETQGVNRKIEFQTFALYN